MSLPLIGGCHLPFSRETQSLRKWTPVLVNLPTNMTLRFLLRLSMLRGLIRKRKKVLPGLYCFGNSQCRHCIQDSGARGDTISVIQEVKWEHHLYCEDGLYEESLVGQGRTSYYWSWILKLCWSCIKRKYSHTAHAYGYARRSSGYSWCAEFLSASSNLIKTLHYLWTWVRAQEHWQEGNSPRGPLWQKGCWKRLFVSP